MLAVVVSRADSASEHIGDHLLDLADWRETVDDDRADEAGGGTVFRRDGMALRTFGDLHLDLERPAAAFDDPDLLVFVSRHAGETGPLLTAHHTGNFGPAEYGGADGSLSRACPHAHRRVVCALSEYAPEGYDVGMECTHHGPSDVGAPSMFVEVGSDETQWADPDAARAVARAVLDLGDATPDAPWEDGTRRHLVGFGGGHYCPRFERVVRETDWAVGHVGADWALEAMGDPRDNRDVIRQAFAASAADRALLDGDRPAVRDVVSDLGYRVVSETWVRETSGVPLPLVEALESTVERVEEGLRFGEPARDRDAGDVRDPTVLDAEGDLLPEATGIDRAAAKAALEDVALAFDTEDNGSRVVGPVVVADPADETAVVAALADLLRETYDDVEREGREVIARESAFDPALAREAGVPEGPLFGRLSAGEAVEVDGRTVEPAAVTRERERRFTL